MCTGLWGAYATDVFQQDNNKLNNKGFHAFCTVKDSRPIRNIIKSKKGQGRHQTVKHLIYQTR